jgi:coenzyme F420-reducing hydrogenase delta subunit
MSSFQGTLVVFGCQNSARRAADRAAREKQTVAPACSNDIFGVDRAAGEKQPWPAPVQFITVPCAGRVSWELILAALEKGARGVMVLGCHPGACHHLYGSERARERVLAVQELLPRPAWNRKRVAFATLGPDSRRRQARPADGVRNKTRFVTTINSVAQVKNARTKR